MTVELDPTQISSERLAMMYRLSQSFNACCLDINELLHLVMDEIMAATGAERGVVIVANSPGKGSRRVTCGLDQAAMRVPQFRHSRRVMGQAARERQPILTDNMQANAQLDRRYGEANLDSRTMLCVPLITRERVIGLLYVDRLMGSGALSYADLELLNAIAASAAVAIDNAHLYQAAVANARLEREIAMAHDIQARLLPQHTPLVSGWEFATHWQPANEVAGDYFDFIQGHAPGVGLVIADVSGKGIPAALFMADARAIVRASVHSAPSPAEAIRRANRLIWADASQGMFVSLFYGLIDPERGELTYVNAGHDPPYLYRGREARLRELRRTGMVLGVDGEATYEQQTVILDPGDFVVFYTDGVTDATDEKDQFFGSKRLQRLLLDNQLASADGLVGALRQAIGDFMGESTAFDDIALIVARYQA